MRIKLEKIFQILGIKQSVFSNIGYLLVLQAFTYIFPLLAYPLIIQRVGVANFGLIAFANSVTAYFLLISDFGFNLTSAQKVSLFRNNKTKLQDIFIITIFSKLLLSLVLFSILLSLIIFTDRFGSLAKLFLFNFTVVLGQALFPIWFLQGIEKMRYITVFQFFSKSFNLFLLFLFVKTPDDYFLVPFFNGISGIIIGIISIFYVIKMYDFIFFTPKISEIMKFYKDSFVIFLAVGGTSLYRNINTLLITFITNDSYLVGIYAIVEKIIFTIQSMITPISQALFPHFSLSFTQMSIISALKTLKNISIVYFFILISIVSIIFFFSKFILSFFLRDVAPEAIFLLKLMSFVPLFGGFNYLLGVIGLINLNFKKHFTKYVYIAGLSSSILSGLLILKFSIVGAAISLNFAEFLLLFMILNKIFKIRNNYASR